jgi:uncharacterized protein with PQ loop repeat
MDAQLLNHVLAVAGTTLYVVRAAPATVRLARGQKVEPAMAKTFGLLLLTGIWWIAYSLEIGNTPTLISSGLSLIAPAYGLVLLWRQREVARGVAFVVGAGLLVVLLEREVAPLAVGLTAAVASAGLTLPETVQMFRGPYKSAASTSLGTWVLMAANAVVWLVYALLIGHPLLGAAGAVQLPCSIIVMERTLRARRGPVTTAGLEARAGLESTRRAYPGTGAGGTAGDRTAGDRSDEEAAA